MPKVVLVVGHSAQVQGAAGVPPLEPEYTYNMDLAQWIQDTLTSLGVSSEIVTRNLVGIAGAYHKVNLLKPALAIELHYNSFNGRTRGTETLYSSRHPRSEALAQVIQQAMCKALNRKPEQDRGIKKLKAGDRGSLNVSLADCPSVLVEPFFGDHIDDARIGRERRIDLAKAIAEAVRDFLDEKI